MGNKRQRHAHACKDEAGQKPHMEARDGQKMREVRAPEIVQNLLAHGRAIPGRDSGRHRPRLPRDRLLHGRAQRHAQPKHREREPRFRHLESQRRTARIAHRAQLIEPGVTLEIEPVWLCRGWRGRQMACEHGMGPACP